jgi:membrane-associated phospholipid phosphatase
MNMSDTTKKLTIFCAEYLVIVVAIIFVYLIYIQDTVAEEISIILIGGILFLLVTAFAAILKRIIHKNRPVQDFELFVPFGEYAFPSGHATMLFAVTFFIFTESYTLGLISLLFSSIIVVARVKSRVHDAKDIIGGVLIGTLLTYALLPYIATYVITYLTPSIAWWY